MISGVGGGFVTLVGTAESRQTILLLLNKTNQV
jgi:hypothetical protein